MEKIPMNQYQFDTIVKVIESGAPALANELCNALNDLVNDYNALRKEKEANSSEVVDAVVEKADKKIKSVD